METSVQSGGPIVVIAPIPAPSGVGITTGGGSTGTGGSAGSTGTVSGGSSSPAGYRTKGASDAGNKFADGRISDTANDADGNAVYAHEHDTLAKFYDYAVSHPNQMVNLGDGVSVTAQKALNNLANTGFVITEDSKFWGNGLLAHGAYTQEVSGHPTVFIDPTATNTQNYMNYGEGGLNYEITHEMGHALNYFNDYARGYTDEAAANTAGKSILDLIGLPSFPGTPPGGYH